MREIKYRFWSEHSKCFLSTDIETEYITDMQLVMNGLGETFIVDKEKGKLVYQDGIIKSQFTGFEDRLENEIFSGDILKLDPGYNQPPLYAQVIWNEDDGCWDVINTEESIYQSLAETLGYFCCYVVGNIYESPELLQP